ncbi:MAG TPA: MBL fold metallo-hydrolase [Candidatus Micrarchaeia archaeon]|nr:MBL fold metallo-hydrolase [Candidatus Micrarchaeia archaeon]
MAAEAAGPGPLRVIRLLAPNPGPMTLAGTNTWLVGDDEVTVVDPGPDDPGHRQAIQTAAAPGRIVRLVCTHSHPDHREGAAQLAASLGVGVGVHHTSAWGRGELALHDGDRLEVGRHALRVLHTPGHAPDHICLFAEDDGACFTGDHVLGGATTVIDPPAGDLPAYLLALRRLRSLPLRVLLPGHGDPLTDPTAAIDGILRHRAERERAVLAALADGPHHPTDLVPGLYAAVTPTLWAAAARTVLAHCLKLEAEGRVERVGDDPGGEPTFALRA